MSNSETSDGVSPHAPTDAGFDPVTLDGLPKVAGGSSMGAEWWLARRNMTSNRGEVMLSVVTVLSVLAVTLAVATLNVVLGIMTGFEAGLRDKILGANAHVVVTGTFWDPDAAADEVQAIQGVKAAAPFIYTEMMIRGRGGTSGIILKGLDPQRSGPVTAVLGDLKVGLVDDSGRGTVLDTPEQRATVFARMAGTFGPPAGQPEAARLPGIIVGVGLAETLDLGPGDTVQVIQPLGDGVAPMGMASPRFLQLRVAGVFDSGMFDYNNKWTYVSNAVLSEFLRLDGAATGIEATVYDIYDADTVEKRVAEALGDRAATVKDWSDLNKDLYEALQTEKIVMGLLMFLFVIMAALLIITTQIMQVVTKAREIAILKALGASNAAVLRVFVIQGALIGLVGTLGGTALGLGLCWWLDWYEWPLKAEVYFFTKVPVVVDPWVVVAVAAATFLTCVGATAYPALRAASLDPVSGLRYE